MCLWEIATLNPKDLRRGGEAGEEEEEEWEVYSKQIQ